MGIFVDPCQLIEPFVAPEFFCTDLAYVQTAAPGVVRFGLVCQTGETVPILKVKILLPLQAVPFAVARTSAFLTADTVRRVGAHSAVLM